MSASQSEGFADPANNAPRLARLVHAIDAIECARRNALRRKLPGYALGQGTVGEIIETLEGGTAFLVEFREKEGHRCDWLGVLYAVEIELISVDGVAHTRAIRTGCVHRNNDRLVCAQLPKI